MSLQNTFTNHSRGQAPARPAWVATVEQLAGRGLPGAQVSAYSSSDREGTFTVSCRINRKTVFKADDCCIDRGTGKLTLAKERGTEIRTEAGDKGAGLGKIFLYNMLELADKIGLKTVDMRGGREDGAWYWSYRGAHMESGPGTVPYQRFEDGIRKNMEGAPPAVQAAAEAVLAEPGKDVNARLARIEGGRALFNNNEIQMAFHLDDSDQMAAVRRGLGDIDAAMQAVKARFATAPGAAPQ